MWDFLWIYSLNSTIFSYPYRATNHVIQNFEACKICKKLRCKHKGHWKSKASYKKEIKTENEKKLEPEKKKKEKNRKLDTENEGQYKCKQCNFMFTNLGSYKDHKRKIHVEKQKPYRCNRCHKQFSKEEALKIHQQIIHHSPLINSAQEKKRFPCSICERKFSSQQYLKKHIASHVISSISVWKKKHSEKRNPTRSESKL